MAETFERIGIVGAGAWGTALAAACRSAGRTVRLWAREPEVVAEINDTHENATFLPGVALDRGIGATGDLADLAAGCDALLLVTPAQALGSTAERLATEIDRQTPLVICAKGIELDSGRLMTEVLSETLPDQPVAVLSGPTFAREVAEGRPTAVTLAAEDRALGERLVASLGSRRFRPYLSDDPLGAQVGGAVKNVVAIACGIAHGLGMGANTRAALITRGLAEIARLGAAKGARRETLMGLSGIGDLTLTCTDSQSRNYSLGEAMGAGRTLDDILAERKSVAEGVYSAAAVTTLASRLGVDMPIAEAVDAVLNRGADLGETIQALLARPFRAED